MQRKNSRVLTARELAAAAKAAGLYWWKMRERRNVSNTDGWRRPTGDNWAIEMNA